VEAYLLLNVVDLSDPDYLEKLEVVEELLLELGAERERIVTVFNKVDKCPGLQGSEGIYISASQGQGLTELLQTISSRLN